MEQNNNRDKLVELLGKETCSGLEHFIQKIDEEQADIIMLIARKALCLFHLLPYLKIEFPNAEIVSDRVLDLNMQYFKGKKVIVVDDTLILGTTLKNIKEKLEKAKCDVKIYTYSIDRTNWQKDLIKPDYVEKFYSSDAILNFCNTLVKSFSMVSLPYLVDFPITNIGKMSKSNYQQLINEYNLEVIELPNYDYSNNSFYTILLNDLLKKQFYNQVGNTIRQIVDVLKIRVYCIHKQDENVNLRFVPIVLLKSMNINSINNIFFHLIKNSPKRVVVERLLNSPQIRLRFIQYYLSVQLGIIFFQQIQGKVKLSKYKFKKSELIYIFGKDIADICCQLLHEDISPIHICLKDTDTFIPDENIKDLLPNVTIKGYNILQSFQEIFANLVDQREIPARKWYNNMVGTLLPQVKNRLLNGIAFDKICTFFCERLGIETTEYIKEIISICLDICNDMGISVPIICNNNNTLFRAFRHGELGKKSKGNVFLLKNYLDAFCETNGYDCNAGFDKVLLEKLSVIFYRIGANNDFIENTYDYNDPESINIGFYLFGAIPIINNANDYFPNKVEDWFLNYHCYSLFKLCNDNKYHYDIVPTREGTSISDRNIIDAKMLGKIMGYVIKPNWHNKDKQTRNTGRPLNIERLTLIASCYTLGDITNALAAELNIILNWTKIVNKIKIVNYSIFSDRIFLDFQNSTVYKSFNQALFKFSNAFTPENNVPKIIKSVTSYIKDSISHHELTDIDLKTWEMYVSQLGIGNENMFVWEDNKIDTIKRRNFVYRIFREISYAGLFLIYVRYIIEVYENMINPSIGIGSKFVFVDYTTSNQYARTLVNKKVKEIKNAMLNKNEISIGSKVGKAFLKKNVNNKVTFKYCNVTYYFHILSINNENMQYTSELEFDAFYNNVLTVLGAGDPLFNNIYQKIKQQMKNVSDTTPQPYLVSILDNTIKELTNRKEIMESIIMESKIIYRQTKDNFVTLL